MRIILKTQDYSRELIVKIRYDKTKPQVKYSKDKYGRSIAIAWSENKTTVQCREYDPKQEPNSQTIYVGSTVCDYRDIKQYTRKIGREIAWDNCIIEMYNQNFITRNEAIQLQKCGLNATTSVIDMTDEQNVKITKSN